MNCRQCHEQEWVCEGHEKPYCDECASMPCPKCNTERPPRLGPGISLCEVCVSTTDKLN